MCLIIQGFWVLKRKSILDYKLERISDILDASHNLTTSISKNEWFLLFKQFWKALESKLIFPHAQNCWQNNCSLVMSLYKWGDNSFVVIGTLKVNRYYCRHFSVAVSFSKISFRNSGHFHNIMNTFKVWKSNNTDFVEQLK